MKLTKTLVIIYGSDSIPGKGKYKIQIKAKGICPKTIARTAIALSG